MLTLLQDHVSEAAAPLIFLILFLVIVGGALWVTPRLAHWLDEKDAQNKGYFDGMLEEDPSKDKDKEPSEEKSKEANQ